MQGKPTEPQYVKPQEIYTKYLMYDSRGPESGIGSDYIYRTDHEYASVDDGDSPNGPNRKDAQPDRLSESMFAFPNGSNVAHNGTRAYNTYTAEAGEGGSHAYFTLEETNNTRPGYVIS